MPVSTRELRSTVRLPCLRRICEFGRAGNAQNAGFPHRENRHADHAARCGPIASGEDTGSTAMTTPSSP